MNDSPDGTTRWLADASHWLERNPASPDGDGVQAWTEHQASPTTVVTLFGAYDSAKSALLRRLLVDVGAPCPDWLTISARHETFEVAPVDIGGVLVRDTPGLAPDAQDPRGLQNNAKALFAAALTDVLLLVMPPQLLTGELEIVRGLLRSAWPSGTLRCAITRFDEAGIDPTGDPAAYLARAKTKIRELRLALSLGDDVPVYVVAPDPYQIAGEERQPDPSVWDPFRDWDGIAGLRQDLLTLKVPDAAYRQAAGVRFLIARVHQAADDLRRQQAVASDAVTTAQQNAHRQARALSSLNDIRSTAQVRLDGCLERLLDLALHAGMEQPDRLVDQTVAELDQWLAKSQAEVDELMRDFEAEFARQMERPAWKEISENLERLVTLERPESNGRAATAGEDGLSRGLRGVNDSLTKSIKEVRDVFSKRTSDFSAKAGARATRSASLSAASEAGKVEKVLQGGEVLVALGPALLDIRNLISDFRRERAQEKAQREILDRVERQLNQVGEKAKEIASTAFSQYADEAQAVITDTAGALEAFVRDLTARASALEAASNQAEALLRAAPTRTV